jgi:hypothetical protein
MHGWQPSYEGLRGAATQITFIRLNFFLLFFNGLSISFRFAKKLSAKCNRRCCPARPEISYRETKFEVLKNGREHPRAIAPA